MPLEISSQICDLLDQKVKTQANTLRQLHDELSTTQKDLVSLRREHEDLKLRSERERLRLKNQCKEVEERCERKMRGEVGKVLKVNRELEFELFKERVTNNELIKEIDRLKSLFKATRSDDMTDLSKAFDALRADMMSVVKAQCAAPPPTN
ncbi:hypothetical protein HDU67_007895 [Dinochytrium kinnereticum]|nr:hypothetical protein HDU67_007895 [Dinochytrium kinnereticum]